MSSHGHSQLEDWRSYTERLQNYFIANDIKSEAKQRANFLSVCGPRTYKLIRSLLSPQEPKDVNFPDIINQMSDHYQPKPSVNFIPALAGLENLLQHSLLSLGGFQRTGAPLGSICRRC